MMIRVVSTREENKVTWNMELQAEDYSNL